jgi:hypothetical protein
VAGRGAERLATPNAQEIWVEGRVVEEVVHHNDRTAQKKEEGDRHFKIPKKFETGHEAFLVATEADLARVVRDIKLSSASSAPTLSSKRGRITGATVIP